MKVICCCQNRYLIFLLEWDNFICAFHLRLCFIQKCVCTDKKKQNQTKSVCFRLVIVLVQFVWSKVQRENRLTHCSAAVDCKNQQQSHGETKSLHVDFSSVEMRRLRWSIHETSTYICLITLISAYSWAKGKVFGIYQTLVTCTTLSFEVGVQTVWGIWGWPFPAYPMYSNSPIFGIVTVPSNCFHCVDILVM